MACRKEEEGVVVVSCWAGGVVVVEPVGLPNMASMVGRSAAPRGVERKSEGRSDCVNYLFSDGRLKGTGKKGKQE
jgi:hypothetical protein